MTSTEVVGFGASFAATERSMGELSCGVTDLVSGGEAMSGSGIEIASSPTRLILLVSGVESLFDAVLVETEAEMTLTFDCETISVLGTGEETASPGVESVSDVTGRGTDSLYLDFLGADLARLAS
jgi:hypothetical protein